MTTMTNLTKTTTRTKPSPRSACPSCTSSSSCHVRGLINHIVLFPLLQLTVSFTLCLRRALKNTGFNRMSCFHPRLSELRTSHIITGCVLCLLGMIVFSWRTLLKFRGVTLFPVAALLLDVICVTLWNLPSRRKPHLRTAVQRAVGKCCVISVWSSSLLFLNDPFYFVVVFELAGLICILMIRRLMNWRTYKAGCYFLPHRGQVFGCVDSFSYADLMISCRLFL